MKFVDWMLIAVAGPIACSAGVLLLVFGLWGLDRGSQDGWVLLLLGIGTLIAGVALLFFEFDRLKKARRQKSHRENQQ
jgi:hypothetical protein